ncbi:hypothetical protein DEJ00_12710 [Curtobacterium sp. MCLR17_039]|nr:hypothetical protein DEJ00_12710 [Curtobacterium sp. MCLR17_039]
MVSELVDGEWRDRGILGVQNWWPKLNECIRTCLLEHAEERIPTEVLHCVVAAGGIVPGTAWEGQGYEFRLPEAAVAWIAAQR